MKHLTDDQIEWIMKDLPSLYPKYLPPSIRDSYIQRTMNAVREQLRKEKIEDDFTDIDCIKKTIQHHFEKSLVQAGEGVGVICAQSIGERQTQLTLNSFHSSGLSVATVITGVPRFLELLNATKEPKISSHFFHLSMPVQTPKECRHVIKDSLVYQTLNDLVVSEKIFIKDRIEEFWFGAYEIVYSNQFRYFNSGITFYLDKQKIHRFEIQLSVIKDKIESIYSDVCVVISPLYIGQLDIFIDTAEIRLPESNLGPSFVKDMDPVEIYLEEIVKTKLLEIDICGIKNIKEYHYQKAGDRWLIQVQGSNLIDVLSLPYVDQPTIYSNNMWDIFSIMGIEAVREFLIEEFTNVVSSDGTFINPSHISLLVDIMTFQGTINSISRYGMKKEQIGVLSRASFEESLEQFCNAGFYSEKDHIKSVSANIMCGKRSSIGSGLCTLKMDWGLIRSSSRTTKSADDADK